MVIQVPILRTSFWLVCLGYSVVEKRKKRWNLEFELRTLKLPIVKMVISTMTLTKSCSELWRCQLLKAKFEKPSLKLANDWGMRSTCLEKMPLRWSSLRSSIKEKGEWNFNISLEWKGWLLSYILQTSCWGFALGVYIIEDTPAAAPLKKKPKNRRTKWCSSIMFWSHP